MKIKQLYLIEDYKTVYQIHHYVSKELVEINIELGDVMRLINLDKFKAMPGKDVRKSLFPKSKVAPLYFDKITEDTAIILRLRPTHYLFNTTLSSDELTKELVYDTNKNILSYIFFNIQKRNLTIRPRIAKDDKGLLEYFGDHLDDNLIRESILKFMDEPNVPNNPLNKLRLERAENSIVYEGDVFAIRFRGSTIRLQNEVSIRDLIYIIMNKVSNQNAVDLWINLRGENKQRVDETTAFGNIQRNQNRLLKRLKDIEKKMNIPLPERFSKFVDNHIVLDSSLCSISYEAPQEIQWEFDLPQNIFRQ